MVAADAVAVAIATDTDDFQLVIAQFDAGAHRQRTAMQGVHAVGVDEAGQVRRAADAADDHDLVGIEAELEERGLQRGQHGKIAATGAPVGMDLALVTLFDQLAGRFDGFSLR